MSESSTSFLFKCTPQHYAIRHYHRGIFVPTIKYLTNDEIKMSGVPLHHNPPSPDDRVTESNENFAHKILLSCGRSVGRLILTYKCEDPNNSGGFVKDISQSRTAFVVAKTQDVALNVKSLILLTAGHNTIHIGPPPLDPLGTQLKCVSYHFCDRAESGYDLNMHPSFFHKAILLGKYENDAFGWDRRANKEVVVNDFALFSVDVPEKLWQKTRPLYPVSVRPSELVAAIGYPEAPPPSSVMDSIDFIFPQGKLYGPDAVRGVTLEAQKIFHGYNQRVASTGYAYYARNPVSFHTASLLAGCAGAPLVSLCKCPQSFVGVCVRGSPAVASYHAMNHNVFLSTSNIYFEKLYKEKVLHYISDEEIDHLDPETKTHFLEFRTHLLKTDYTSPEALIERQEKFILHLQKDINFRCRYDSREPWEIS